MTVRELYDRLSQMIPQSLSCEWDHDGLMICPNRDRKVSKVLVALDPTEDILELACREHFDVVLTHHPFLFHGLETVDESDPKGKRVVELILNGVSVMCFHTRLDALEGGVNDALAETLMSGKYWMLRKSFSEMRVGKSQRWPCWEDPVKMRSKRPKLPAQTLF